MSNDTPIGAGGRERITRDPRCPGFAAVPLSRRSLLETTGLGFGWAAFGSLAHAAGSSGARRRRTRRRAPTSPRGRNG